MLIKQIQTGKYFKVPILLFQEARNGAREDRIFSFLKVFVLEPIAVSLGSVQ